MIEVVAPDAYALRDVIAEVICNIERGVKGVGYFHRHGEVADALIAGLAERRIGFVHQPPHFAAM